MSKLFHFLFAVIFFFVLPLGAYHLVVSLTQQLFVQRQIPFPSECFAIPAGIGASFCVLGVSFFIFGNFLKKRRD